jgi:hypothetical protein
MRERIEHGGVAVIVCGEILVSGRGLVSGAGELVFSGTFKLFGRVA